MEPIDWVMAVYGAIVVAWFVEVTRELRRRNSRKRPLYIVVNLDQIAPDAPKKSRRHISAWKHEGPRR